MDNDVRVAVQCKDTISFPMDIDLTKFVHPVAGGARTEQPLQYTLTAIILHRGSSASSGHYVSIVKDERLGMWWKYDDDSVTNMGVHPFKGAKWDPVGGDAEANGSTGAKKASTKKKSAAKAGKAAPKAPAAALGTKAQGGKTGAGTRGGKESEVIQIEEDAGTPDVPETCHVPAPAAPTSGAPAPTPPLAVACRRKRTLADVNYSCAGTPALGMAVGADGDAAGAISVISISSKSTHPEDAENVRIVLSFFNVLPNNSARSPTHAVCAADAKSAPLPQDLSSKDAYMLIYTLSLIHI